jgi:hypothetical protein
MLTRLSRAGLSFALLLGIGLVAPPRAHALGVVTVNVTLGAFTDTFSAVGNASKTYASIVDGGTTFTNVTVSATTNSPGTVTNGQIQQQSVTSTGSTGTGMLVVTVTTDPFTLPGFAGNLMLLTTGFSGSDPTASKPATFLSKADGTQIGGTLSRTGPGVFSTSNGGSFTRGASYTLSDVMSITAGDGSINLNGTTTVTATPEPTTIVMALVAIPALAFGFRRRLRGARV